MNFELRKHTTNHNSFSVTRETNTNLTDNTNPPRFKNLFVKFEQFVFENPTHHTLSDNPCSQIISVKFV